MDSLKKTTYWCRAAVVLLAALQLSCSKYETVEAEIIGFEEKSTIGVPSLVGLKLSPPTSKGRELAIKFELCPSLPINREPACTEPQIQLGEADSPGLYDHVVSVVTDQKTLSARDLRIGQRIRT